MELAECTSNSQEEVDILIGAEENEPNDIKNQLLKFWGLESIGTLNGELLSMMNLNLMSNTKAVCVKLTYHLRKITCHFLIIISPCSKKRLAVLVHHLQ